MSQNSSQYKQFAPKKYLEEKDSPSQDSFEQLKCRFKNLVSRINKMEMSGEELLQESGSEESFNSTSSNILKDDYREQSYESENNSNREKSDKEEECQSEHFDSYGEEEEEVEESFRTFTDRFSDISSISKIKDNSRKLNKEARAASVGVKNETETAELEIPHQEKVHPKSAQISEANHSKIAHIEEKETEMAEPQTPKIDSPKFQMPQPDDLISNKQTKGSKNCLEESPKFVMEGKISSAAATKRTKDLKVPEFDQKSKALSYKKVEFLPEKNIVLDLSLKSRSSRNRASAKQSAQRKKARNKSRETANETQELNQMINNIDEILDKKNEKKQKYLAEKIKEEEFINRLLTSVKHNLKQVPKYYKGLVSTYKLLINQSNVVSTKSTTSQMFSVYCSRVVKYFRSEDMAQICSVRMIREVYSKVMDGDYDDILDYISRTIALLKYKLEGSRFKESNYFLFCHFVTIVLVLSHHCLEESRSCSKRDDYDSEESQFEAKSEKERSVLCFVYFIMKMREIHNMRSLFPVSRNVKTKLKEFERSLKPRHSNHHGMTRDGDLSKNKGKEVTIEVVRQIDKEASILIESYHRQRPYDSIAQKKEEKRPKIETKREKETSRECYVDAGLITKNIAELYLTFVADADFKSQDLRFSSETLKNHLSEVLMFTLPKKQLNQLKARGIRKLSHKQKIKDCLDFVFVCANNMVKKGNFRKLNSERVFRKRTKRAVRKGVRVIPNKENDEFGSNLDLKLCLFEQLYDAKNDSNQPQNQESGQNKGYGEGGEPDPVSLSCFSRELANALKLTFEKLFDFGHFLLVILIMTKLFFVHKKDSKEAFLENYISSRNKSM